MKKLNLPNSLKALEPLRFKAWLRKNMVKKGATYQDVATEIGIAESSVGNHLRGKCIPRYEVAMLYFEFFELDNKDLRYAHYYEGFCQVEKKYKSIKKSECKKKENDSF